MMTVFQLLQGWSAPKVTWYMFSLSTVSPTETDWWFGYMRIFWTLQGMIVSGNFPGETSSGEPSWTIQITYNSWRFTENFHVPKCRFLVGCYCWFIPLFYDRVLLDVWWWSPEFLPWRSCCPTRGHLKIMGAWASNKMLWKQQLCEISISDPTSPKRLVLESFFAKKHRTVIISRANVPEFLHAASCKSHPSIAFPPLPQAKVK